MHFNAPQLLWEETRIDNVAADERDASAEAEPSRRLGGRAEALKPKVRGVGAFARRHALFLVLLGAGCGLRGVTLFAYKPALFNATEYLFLAEHLRPGGVHPIAYPVFLRALPLDIGLAVIPFVQHLLGLVIAVLIYVLLLRLRVSRWLAALAAAPVLLDAYQLNIEQYVTPETLFELLLVAGCALLLWRRELDVVFAGLAGLAFASAALTRPIGLFVITPALLTVLFLRGRLRNAFALITLFVLPLGAYAMWVHSEYGVYALTASTGKHLYGRVVAFADCSKVAVPSDERVLCLEQPVGQRPPEDELIWSLRSPIARVDAPTREAKARVAEDFAKRMIRGQPLDYAQAVGSDVLRGFAPTRGLGPGEFGDPPWQFHRVFPVFFRSSVCTPKSIKEAEERLEVVAPALVPTRAAGCASRRRVQRKFIERYGEEPSVDQSLASFLQKYQRVGYTPGPLLAAGLVIGFAAALGVGRARRSGLRSAAFLFSGLAVAVCIGANLVAVFAWRYQLPQLVLVLPALAVGLTALTAKREGLRP